MTSEIQMNFEDIRRLAELQVTSLPGSLISCLGPTFVRSFYEYLIRSPHELLFAERGNDGRIVAGCVVSLDRASFKRRLLFATPLLTTALSHLLLMFQALFDGRQYRAIKGAEMIILFTAREECRKGYAGKLLLRVEEALRRRGIAEYSIRTLDDRSNPAFLFYKASGFELCGSIVERGKVLAVMKRSL